MKEDIIIAISTPPGMGALSIIRLSGHEGIFSIVNTFFSKEIITESRKNVTIYGWINDENSTNIDEVILNIYKAPKSFNGENIIEINCHGSVYIQQTILNLFLRQKGIRLAKPGEFSIRAFRNRKKDLTQIEAIADLILADSEMKHRLALKQIKGGVSYQIKDLRKKIVDICSLVELELDFSEEDVTFADRTQLKHLLENIQQVVKTLKHSFKFGNAVKQGIHVSIIGKPNVGKSTLLNLLLEDERAIVSNVPGTTRDVIEDTIIIKGVSFRIIDTAGLRDTNDIIEQKGIQKTYHKIQESDMMLCLIDCLDIDNSIMTFDNISKKNAIYILTKSDLLTAKNKSILKHKVKGLGLPHVFTSQEDLNTIQQVKNQLYSSSNLENIPNIVITNARHYDLLTNIYQIVQDMLYGIEEDMYTDILAANLREISQYLGEITGEISTDDILDNIFSNFCIGK